MSTAQFTCPLIVTIPGQLIASSLWNNEFVNIFTNGNPQGIGAYSDTDPQMQTATDPFPSGTSRPTSLAGELERIRYILNLIIGQSYWYQHPSINLETINTFVNTFPSGTRMLFQQNTVPTGWTRDTPDDGLVIRITSGTVGSRTSGFDIGTGTLTLAHSHTVASHTHDLSNHVHGLSSHTHTSAAHTHTVPRDGWGTGGTNTGGRIDTAGSGSQASADNTSGSTTPGVTGGPSSANSEGPSTNTSGATSPGTDSQLSNLQFKYLDVIVGVKD